MTELPDLESLARHLAAALGPLVTAATGLTAEEGEPGKCQQVWCPVCAAVALASGERHPLITLAAEHASSLLALLNDVATADEGSADAPADAGPDSPPGRYQRIPVTIHDD